MKSLLLSFFCLFASLPSCETDTLQLQCLHSAYNLSQSMIWLNEDELLIGRWDGTIAIFDTKEGLLIQHALIPNEKHGITMLTRLDDETFVSSNGPSSIALWTKHLGNFSLKNTYDHDFGKATSGCLVQIEHRQILVTGHEKGAILLWEAFDQDLFFLSSLHMQTTHPMPNSLNLFHIRDIVPWEKNHIITASEDGDICLIDIASKKIIHRQRYDSNASRGINHLALHGNYLLLANCPSDFSEKNLWLYKIDDDRFIAIDSKNLILDKAVKRAYSFDVEFIQRQDALYFFCSTEEGLLWLGRVQDDTLFLLNHTPINPKGGAVLAINPKKNLLATAGYHIHVFEMSAATNENSIPIVFQKRRSKITPKSFCILQEN